MCKGVKDNNREKMEEMTITYVEVKILPLYSTNHLLKRDLMNGKLFNSNPFRQITILYFMYVFYEI
jgi:hypothetical protein